MGKPELKSPRPRGMISKSRPLTRTKVSTPVRSSANIKVVVRVRPHNQKENGDNSRTVVKILNEQMLIFDPKNHTQAFFYHGVEQKGRDLLRKANKDMQFVFDRVFGFDSSNEEVFENTTKSLIQSLMDGCNCSVFAYGATGAGKTHTMLGNNDNPGITYLTMAELFKAKEELLEERNFELGVSYIEVYNELVQDLLNPGAPLQLRDDGKYGVMVSGIKIHKIEKPEELFSLLTHGNGNRTQHPTDANAESSRSHAVFQVYIQMEYKATREVCAAKLSMIDLAGSERGSATGYGGARFAEGANINKSLLALGNCINSLADGQKYVPYRDSKLTRLLKDSLGGNCQTVMIANVSPSSLSYEDTYNTLKYATRAKKIKSQVKKNVVNVEFHAGEYVKIIENLKREMERFKSQLREKDKEMERVKTQLKEKDKEMEKFKAQLKEKEKEKVQEKKVDSKVFKQLAELIDERRRLVDRMYNVECSESMVAMRRKLKEKADARLSDLLTDDPAKEEAHRRLGDTVDRFNRQENTFKTELMEMKVAKLELENKTTDLLKRYPELHSLVELENERLEKIESRYQTEIWQKKFSFVEEELKTKSELFETNCRMMKSYFMQLRGHGFVSDLMYQEYQNHVNEVQGRKRVTWNSPVDSGFNSTSSTSSKEELRPVKRKINDENYGVLDNTYVMDSPKPKVKVCAEALVHKVYNKSPNVNKKKKHVIGPLKESKGALSAPGQNALGNRKIHKPDVMKKRPFRT